MPITYNWNTGAGTQDVSGLASGNYTVTITDGTGCEVTETYTVNNNGNGVNLISEAVTDATCATCNDGAIDIEVDPAGAPHTFVWSNGATDEDQVALFPGTYTVTITNVDGCDTTITYEVLNTASIDEIGDLLIQIHPNPSNGVIELSFSNVIDNEMQLTVYDAAGRIVIDRTMNMHGSGKRTLDLRELSMGTYVLKLKGETNSYTTRIVIQH